MTPDTTDPAAAAPRAGDGAALPQTVEQQLAPVLEGIPEPKRTEIVHTFEQQFMAVVRSGMTPQIDPETAKILAETIQRDNDNKFKYLSQKQADAAASENREHALATARHRDLMRPIVWAVIGITFIHFCVGRHLVHLERTRISRE